MASRTTAVRYARALAEALPGADDLGAAHDELRVAVELLGTPEAQKTIGSSVMRGKQRRDLTEKIFAAAGFKPVTRRVVTLLAEKHQLAVLPEVERMVGDIVDERRQIVAAELTTAVELPADKQEDYKRSLERSTGRTVRLQTRVDPSILGGAVTRMGSQVYDGSVRRKLELLHQKLRGE